MKQLEQFVEATDSRQFAQKTAFTLLFIDVVGLKQINKTHGRAVGATLLFTSSDTRRAVFDSPIFFSGMAAMSSSPF